MHYERIRKNGLGVLWISVAVALISRAVWLLLLEIVPRSIIQGYGVWTEYVLPITLMIGIYLVALLNRPSSLKASWCLLWLYLIVAWAINMKGHLIADVLLIVSILLVYFVLEGYELAVTDLLDKDVAQFDDKSLALAIKEITKRKSRFYDAREWVVITLAVIVTLRSNFAHLTLPLFADAEIYPHAHELFSILFATFSIIWISQIPPKQLAINNSQAFLTTTRFTTFWPILRVCGIAMEQLHLHSPSELVVWCFRKSAIASSPRRLRPSDVNYFLYGLSIFGYGYHCLKDEITICHDGSGRLVHRGVYYVLASGQTEIAKTLEFDAGADLVSHDTWAYRVPLIGENFADDLRLILDLVSEDKSDELDKKGCTRSLDRVFFFPDAKKSTPSKHSYVVAFPNTFLGADAKYQDSAGALAIGFKAEFSVRPGCFAVPPPQGPFDSKTQDRWTQNIGFPWRSYELEVRLHDSAMGTLVNPMQMDRVLVKDVVNIHETKKISYPTPITGGLRKQIKYPIIGAVYQLTWEIWPS